MTGTSKLLASLAFLIPAILLSPGEESLSIGVPGLPDGGRGGLESSPSSRADPEVQALQNDLQEIFRSTGNRRGRWGILAVSLDRHDTLLALNHHLPMVPASNMKVLTTAAALHVLGPEFRYRTFLLGDGPIGEGRLDGDLILYGTGDPTLSERYHPTETAALDSLARHIAEQGIQEIRGDLVMDGTFFRGPDLHPSWDPGDFNDAFAAPVSAVAIAENVVTIRVEAGSWVGAEPSIFTVPPMAGIPLTNVARTVPDGRRSRVWLFRETPQDPIGIEGEIPLGGADVWRQLPVPDPLLFTGIQMEKALARHGVEVSGGMRVARESPSSRISGEPTFVAGNGSMSPRILATHHSPPLLEILRVVNKESNNFLAESVFKTVGRLVTGDGSFDGGTRAITAFLTTEVGAAPEEIQVRDGSGLSTENLVSPTVFVQTLEYLAGTRHWEDFLGTLPQAGVRRELRRMYRSPAALNLKAKTGTLDRVSALSGVVRTRSGERILFSILSNDVTSEYRAKRAEDRIGIRLASLTRPWPG